MAHWILAASLVHHGVIRFGHRCWWWHSQPCSASEAAPGRNPAVVAAALQGRLERQRVRLRQLRAQQPVQRQAPQVQQPARLQVQQRQPQMQPLRQQEQRRRLWVVPQMPPQVQPARQGMPQAAQPAARQPLVRAVPEPVIQRQEILRPRRAMPVARARMEPAVTAPAVSCLARRAGPASKSARSRGGIASC